MKGRALSFCASAWILANLGQAQSGPDNDPAAAKGYVNNSFHHSAFDSINQFNGQLTVPIAIGPAYPVGPSLSFQLTLTYNSRVTEPGNPTDESNPNYEPVVGDPALGVGWTFTPGKIACGALPTSRSGNLPCYIRPDGAEVDFFPVSPGSATYLTKDATSYRLLRTGAPPYTYTMWDGDGNRYEFGWSVVGYDDSPSVSPGYARDYGRGRDGYYLTSLSDPFGNKLLVTYAPDGTSPCPASCALPTAMRCAGSTARSWIPATFAIQRAGQAAPQTIGQVMTDPALERIRALQMRTFAGGTSQFSQWDLQYGTVTLSNRSAALYCASTSLPTLEGITFPSDIPKTAGYAFDYFTDNFGQALLSRMALPAGAEVFYDYGNYHFYRGRKASFSEDSACGLAPPPPRERIQRSRVYTESGAGFAADAPDAGASNQEAATCLPGSQAQFAQTQIGVLRHTVRGAGDPDAVTDYTQYSFPSGEAGDSAAQTLTVAVLPPDAGGRRRAETTLFWAGPDDATAPPEPGDRVGADLRHAVFAGDPNPALLSTLEAPICGAGQAADTLCASHAVRVTQNRFDYGGFGYNRRLQSTTTYHGHLTETDALAGDYCPAGCRRHTVEFLLRAANPGEASVTWEGNGRHYSIERHSGDLGNDAREVTTYWTPRDGPWLRNVYDRRYESAGGTSVKRYFFFDAGTGFLSGSATWGPDRAYFTCRYPTTGTATAGAGLVANEVTLRVRNFPQPPEPPAALPALCPPLSGMTTIGRSQDLFARQFSYAGASLASSRWMTGPATTAAWTIDQYSRDGATGWILSSTDSAGQTTGYQYDSLHRIKRVTPPGEAPTSVCYDDPRTTVVARAPSALSCPVARTTSGVLTWQQLDFDALGRPIRETRRMPSAAYAKRFTLYDPRDTAYFGSEWVTESAAEGGWAGVPTSCADEAGTYASTRPLNAPGTYRLCFDPLGRPQQIVGGGHSSLVTVDRTDGAVKFSDTREAATVQCLNSSFLTKPSDPKAGTCNAGGASALTRTDRDAYGRAVSVTEPGGDLTSYRYDVNGKLACVKQRGSGHGAAACLSNPGGQAREFVYDAAGFLRSENTPEKGLVTLDDSGSLGNLLQKTEPGGVQTFTLYDFAARPLCDGVGPAPASGLCDDAASSLLTRSFYDGNGFSGGVWNRGKMTRRVSYNPKTFPSAAVTEDFTYDSPVGGRLSGKSTQIANSPVSGVAESWSYTSLGLIGTHNYPRKTGSLAVTSAYDAGLPVGITAGGQSALSAVTYQPSGAVASYTAGNGLRTTIDPDPSSLPRPARIFTTPSGFDTGAYTYDGAGNVIKVGSDSFVYDARSRLTSAAILGAGFGAQSFTYDAYGNLISKTTNGVATGYTLDAGNHVSSSAGVPVTPDARGNVAVVGSEAFNYDAANRLTRHQSASGDWSYLYNGADERVAKIPGSNLVLRRQMAMFLVQARGEAPASGCAAPTRFSDVGCADPDWGYIEKLAADGITSGCGSGQFCPGLSVARDEMATFLAKGKYCPLNSACPAGSVPAAPNPGWSDVTAANLHLANINRIYADQVTTGCAISPPAYCPTVKVTRWQMMAFLARYWPNYDPPLAANSIFTFRDEANRVATEYLDGTVQRDNVYLGNLLVASKTPSGWEYYSSDHLGTPRRVTGAVTLNLKYWPYGDEPSTPLPAQRLQFAAMERDVEGKRYYDHARSADFRLGRFVSPDRIGGRVANPQSWNRYTYCLGNPLKHVDPDGNLTILVHGTWASGSSDFKPGGRFFEHVRTTFPDRTVASLRWSGEDSRTARAEAAQALASYVRAYKFAAGEKLNIVGHSHGGNIAIEAINLAIGRPVDNLVTLGTPARNDYQLTDKALVNNWINVAVEGDLVQTSGGAPFSPAGREQPDATNILIDLGAGPIQGHSLLHSRLVWNLVLPRLEKQASGQ